MMYQNENTMLYIIFCTFFVKQVVAKRGMASSTDCELCDEIQRQGEQSQQPRLSKGGKIVLAASAAIAATIYGIAVPFVLPGFRKICLPYIPATDLQISNVTKCLTNRSGSIIDLGSGDGRIIQQLMLTNRTDETMSLSTAVGVELNTWLVLYSKYKSWRYGLTSHETRFMKQDIFKTDLRKYDNIVVFGVESLMDQLEVKLLNEMSPNAVLLACRFPLPNWSPVYVEGEGHDRVWVYSRESRATGQSDNV